MNTNTDFYKKLVDLYAGYELPTEMENELHAVASTDAELATEMVTLRATVDLSRQDAEPEFTEESYQRVLMKLYARGIEIQTSRPEPVHLQYQLPMQG